MKQLGGFINKNVIVEVPETNPFADIDIEEGVRRANQIHDRILSAGSEAKVTLMQLKEKHVKKKQFEKRPVRKEKGLLASSSEDSSMQQA